MNEIIISQIRQRLEILYQMVDELERSGGGGGEPGTTNYNDLTNKPSVNGHILIGSKTSSDLDLQPVISDLSTIRSGAAAGATAVQPATMNQALSGKQDNLTFDSTPTSGSTNPVTSGGVYTSLTTKVDKVAGKGLSTNDFTNQDKEQITTNKNGIAALEQMNGKKNWIDVDITSQTVSTLDFGVNPDNTIVVDGSKPPSSVSLTINEAVQLPQGDYVLLDGSGVSSSTLNITLFKNTSTWTGTTATNGKFEFTANGTDTYYCRIYVNTAVDNVTFKPMIITKEAYDAGFTDYTPYAPTNRELYEDKADQTEVATIANRGSKNLLPIKNHSVGDVTETNGFRFTVQADGGILIESIGTHSANGDYYLIGQWGNTETLIDCSDGTYTASLEANDDTVERVSMRIYKAGNSHIVNNVYANTSANFTGEIAFIFITAYTDAVIPSGGVVIKPMIRDAAIEDDTYVPYAPTNRELYEMILSLQSGT